MKVLFFGPLADIAGITQIDFSEIVDIDGLKKRIFKKYPEIESHTFLIAVNKKVRQENFTLEENDVVALLPPFSGG